MFLEKEPAPRNALSDADPNVADLWKKVSCRTLGACGRLEDVCRLTARSAFDLRRGRAVGFCGQIAARRFSWRGTLNSLDRREGRGCQVAPVVGETVRADCREIERRMAQTSVRACDFRKALAKEDSQATLFYLDPPYPHTDTKSYLVREEPMPADVLSAVRGLQGKAIVSYNDHPSVLRESRGFHILRVLTRQNMATKGVWRRELLLANFPIRCPPPARLREFGTKRPWVQIPPPRLMPNEGKRALEPV